MEVGVRELKAKLSFYLKRAAAGELITVTDRGSPSRRSVHCWTPLTSPPRSRLAG